MRNLLSTPATDVILVAAGGRRQLLESPRVPLPEVARLGQTNTPTGTAQRAVPTVRLTEIGSTRTAEWDITLADQIAGDQDEIGDGMVLIDRDLLGLVWPEPEKIRLRTRKSQTGPENRRQVDVDNHHRTVSAHLDQ